MLAPIFEQSDPSVLFQEINITTMNGVVSYNIQELDQFQRDRMLLATLFGVRAGASAVVSIILFLLTARRHTPVYIFNQTSLVLFFAQSTLFLVNTFSPFGALSTVFTNSYASVTGINVNVSVATSVFQLLFIISIQCSLFFQARAVFPRNSHAQVLVTVILGLMSVATIIIYTLYIAQNCRLAANPVGPTLFKGRFGYKLPSISQIMFAASISLCTLIFVGKLFFAIRTRSVLGLKQFGPMQIVCIMGTQSMIVPAVLTVISFTESGTTPIYSMASFTVVISLPLSAMWAASANTNSSPKLSSTMNTHQIRKHIGVSSNFTGRSDHQDRGGSGKDFHQPSFESLAVTTTADVRSKVTRNNPSIWERISKSAKEFFVQPSLSSRRRPPPIELRASPIRSRNNVSNHELSYLDSAYTPGTSSEFMTRSSLEARGGYPGKYQMSTHVSISNVDSQTPTSSRTGAFGFSGASSSAHSNSRMTGEYMVKAPSTGSISPLGKPGGVGIII